MLQEVLHLPWVVDLPPSLDAETDLDNLLSLECLHGVPHNHQCTWFLPHEYHYFNMNNFLLLQIISLIVCISFPGVLSAQIVPIYLDIYILIVGAEDCGI